MSVDLATPEILKAPFPWFGGKSRCVDLVWPRFGDVSNYVEPFFGSGAMLLGKPEHIDCTETINDKDGFVANFWRAIATRAEDTAKWADNPVNECDLHARHVWLLERRDELNDRLCGDPEYCDPRIAGYWVWGQSCWIGGGWCSGQGAWWIDDEKKFVKRGGAGQGVNRQLVHLGDAGQGVNRKIVHLGDAGQGIQEYFGKLMARMRYVRVCCGDWSRICGPSVTISHGITGVFLDPPYADTADRDARCYSVDSLSVAHDVREWAIANGDNPLLRIALCGYEGEHEMPDSWECVPWKARGGYANQGSGSTRGVENATRERIWFSPHCLPVLRTINADRRQSLFGEEDSE